MKLFYTMSAIYAGMEGACYWASHWGLVDPDEVHYDSLPGWEAYFHPEYQYHGTFAVVED